MKKPAVAAVLATVAAFSSVARAEPATEVIERTEVDSANLADRVERRGARRHKRMLMEALAIQAIGTAWYWRNTGDGFGAANIVDWQLGFEKDALSKKLSLGSEGWRFDGNAFELNAICHPMFGALTYWSARKNNYGVAESFLISTLVSGTWELFTEWAEYGSINDALSTSTTGVPIGEAAYQLMHHWRRANYSASVGAGSQDGDAFTALGARITLDTLPLGEGKVVGGRKVGLSLEVPFDGALRGIEGGVKTSLVGYYRNTPHSRLYVGTSAEFYYRDEKQRDTREWDMLAMVAVGPTVDFQVQTGGLQLAAGTDLYADFGMLKSAAYDNWRGVNPMAVVRNSMQDRERPYYFARGFTASPRIQLQYAGVRAGAQLALSRFDSINGADRDQEMMSADPQITDVDTRAQAWVGYTRGKLSVTVDRRLAKRDGAMGAETGDQGASTTMLAVAYAK